MDYKLIYKPFTVLEAITLTINVISALLKIGCSITPYKGSLAYTQLLVTPLGRADTHYPHIECIAIITPRQYQCKPTMKTVTSKNRL